MGYLLIAFAIAAIITYLAIPVIITIAREKHLVDVPDNRKLHKDPIPSLGGIGIFVGFIIALLLIWPNAYWGKNPVYDIQYFAAACLIIFFLGLKDDIIVISPLKKFIGQLLAVWIIVYKCNIQITSFYGVFGVYELPNAVSLGITYFALVLIINSFNLIDGVDGLSGSLTFISMICFAIYFLSYGTYHIAYGVLAASLAGAVSSFLIFNYHPAKIFMGDTGSLLIGLINGVLLIKFMNLTAGLELNTVNRFSLVGGSIVGLSFIVVPLFDTARVFGLRILKGGSPFTPDRNHIHHILLDKGFSHKYVTIILSITSIFLIGISYIASYFFVATGALVVLVLSAVVLFAIAYFYPKKKHLKNQKKKTDSLNSKLVILNKTSSSDAK